MSVLTHVFEPKIGAAPGTQPRRYISMLAWLYTEQRGMFCRVKRSDRWYGEDASQALNLFLAKSQTQSQALLGLEVGGA